MCEDAKEEKKEEAVSIETVNKIMKGLYVAMCRLPLRKRVRYAWRILRGRSRYG